MAKTDKAEKKVLGAIRSLLKNRDKGAPDVDVSLDSDLYGDLELDSLEVAELSAALEEDLGVDPYSEGQEPRTVAEVVEFYDKT